LNRFLVAFESFNQELHVCFYKEDLSFLLLTEGVELQHLNQALTSLLNYCDLKVIGKQLHTDVEVAKDVVDVASDFLLLCFHHLIEAAEEVVVDVKEELDAPLFLVGEHRLDQLVRLVDYSELLKLAEGELLRLH
jgi:hypothetical protein